MAELYLPLFVTPFITGIHLRQLCGKNELMVEDTTTATALSMLDDLITSTNDAPDSIKHHAAKFVTADRDRILAHLYVSIYGQKVESTLHCTQCAEKFDLDFSLTQLLEHYRLMPGQLSAEGTCELEPGVIFRLPTGEDELLSAGLSPAEAEDLLMNRCLVTREVAFDKEVLQRKMAEIAPVLNVEMQAQCPECGQSQTVQFDIQSFLLTKLQQERNSLFTEIHSIAKNYHWAYDAILALPRQARKKYAQLILAEM